MEKPAEDVHDAINRSAYVRLAVAKSDLNEMLEKMYVKKNWRHSFEHDFTDAAEELFRPDGTGMVPTYLPKFGPGRAFVLAFVEAVVKNRVDGLPAQSQDWYKVLTRAPRKKLLAEYT
jgi:hypothetical protein